MQPSHTFTAGTAGSAVFDEPNLVSTLDAGIFLCEFTFGHANQLAAVARWSPQTSGTVVGHRRRE